MPRQAKAWKFKSPVSQNKEPFKPKICLYKGFIFPWDRQDIARLTINDGHLDFQMYLGGGVGHYSSPRPLSSFDTHARWQPVTQTHKELDLDDLTVK